MQQCFCDQYFYLGKRIAYFRKIRGLSQMQLAEKANISRTHMSRVENGDTAVSLDTIFFIAEALETPVSRLFERDETIEKTVF